jgi:hypothetical protein
MRASSVSGSLRAGHEGPCEIIMSWFLMGTSV